MQVTVKLFGAIREALDTKELLVELADGATLGDLRAQLAAEHAIFEEMGERAAGSVNLEMCAEATALRAGDEVAFLPPVSGGAGEAPDLRLVSLSEAPIDENEVAERVVGRSMGGVVSFVGAVRDHARGSSIEHLEYEAYPEMALREMAKITDAAAERWPGTRVAIAHRTGRLEIGDAAVVIVAASAHRAEAFDACRFAIDTLKETVPIWKKEFASDGTYWVDDRP